MILVINNSINNKKTETALPEMQVLGKVTCTLLFCKDAYHCLVSTQQWQVH